MALAIAAGGRLPGLADALDAERVAVRRRSLEELLDDLRHLGGGRQEVVEEGGGSGLADWS